MTQEFAAGSAWQGVVRQRTTGHDFPTLMRIERRQGNAIEGRLARIRELVDYTTVTVELVERTPYTPQEAPPLSVRTGRAFWDSLGAIGTVLQWLVLAVVAVTPWLVALCVVVVPVAFVLRAVRGQQPPAQAPPASEKRPPAPPPADDSDESPPTIM